MTDDLLHQYPHGQRQRIKNKLIGVSSVTFLKQQNFDIFWCDVQKTSKNKVIKIWDVNFEVKNLKKIVATEILNLKYLLYRQ